MQKTYFGLCRPALAVIALLCVMAALELVFGELVIAALAAVVALALAVVDWSAHRSKVQSPKRVPPFDQ